MLQKGRSLHIGLNHVDTQAYQQQGFNVPELSGCINDATAMQSLAANQGFITQILTDDQAISSEVIRLISSYAMELTAGDIFCITFSGHGGQVDDVNGDEDDNQDETWVLWDRMLIDDELFQLFSQFKSGVRIVMLSDSCHSGTVAKMILHTALNNQYRQLKQMVEGNGSSTSFKGLVPGLRNLTLVTDDLRSTREMQAIVRAASSTLRFRGLTAEMSRAIYQKNKRAYDTYQFLAGRAKDVDFAPSLILISGCQDWQLSQDGDQNGLFTETLLKVWDSGSFSGDYHGLWQEIASQMPPSQSPNFYALGDIAAFQQEHPFKVVTQQFDPANTLPPVMNVLGDSTRSRSDSAPNFKIDTEGAPYYVVEFATELDLFDSQHHGGAERAPEKFWASWSESPVYAASNGFYPMPNSVWNDLKNADNIYYRVGTTTSQDGWQDYRVSVPDEGIEDAPNIAIAA